MGRNYRFNEYVNEYDKLLKILKDSFAYTKEPGKQLYTHKKNLNSGTAYYVQNE